MTAHAETPRPKLAPEPEAKAPATRGLDALDRERAASLADEGGAAGAKVEGRLAIPAFDDSDETPALPARLRRASPDGGTSR